jgi:hypothetical protein
MSSVTNPLHALNCGNAAPVLQRCPVRRADQRCYGVTGRALRWAWRRCLGAAITLASLTRNRDHPLAEDCGDLDCPRFPCRMYHNGYRAGYRKGYADGYADGYARGYAEGYGAGYSAGLQARPPLIVYVPAGK